MYLRNSAKAVIIKDESILCITCEDTWGTFYLLPGGGQQPGEPLADALQRECREELGAGVEVGAPVFLRDYIGANHEFAQWEPDVHQVEIMFLCTISDLVELGNGHQLDKDQVGIEWLPLDAIEDYRLYPQNLKPLLKERSFDRCSYLGDVN